MGIYTRKGLHLRVNHYLNNLIENGHFFVYKRVNSMRLSAPLSNGCYSIVDIAISIKSDVYKMTVKTSVPGTSIKDKVEDVITCYKFPNCNYWADSKSEINYCVDKLVLD